MAEEYVEEEYPGNGHEPSRRRRGVEPHAGQRASKLRKQHRKRRKKLRRKAEANRLGMSVEELRAQKALEFRRQAEEHRQQRERKAKEQSPRYRNYGYGYIW